ncbi:MAG: hypothetical protein KKE37_01885 [Verrucomicrobia bacterium]|nr:hypothetical protein [Verrucomicrobiota bacterium]MBU4290047.1 hypothetical protein [Verrucomicrobiota bacterium]MBU4428086.1 hypothetical protein [Verrucomicrobiota bacterium]MCG2679583.1 hypothetical protein [Kiritimatiellia bacterium]
MLVKTQCLPIEEALHLQCGAVLSPLTLAYETYGMLNENLSNAILICHALSGSAHVAGRYSLNDSKPGWWDAAVGPGIRYRSVNESC